MTSHHSRRLMIGLGFPTVLLMTLTAALAQNVKPGAAAAGDAARGKALYASVGCAPCHGNVGRGGSGPRVVPLASTVQAFVKSVRQPPGVMPAYAEKLVSDKQLGDIYAFLHSVGPSPTAETVAAGTPTGNAENGKRLYTATGCYACHGYVGQGGSAGPKVGPHPISFPAFLAALRHPNEMPPYTSKVLSDTQVADIYAFMHTFPEPPNVDSIPLLKVPLR